MHSWLCYSIVVHSEYCNLLDHLALLYHPSHETKTGFILKQSFISSEKLLAVFRMTLSALEVNPAKTVGIVLCQLVPLLIHPVPLVIM